MQEPEQAHWPKVLAAVLALALLVLAVFYPIAGFEFVDYDVRTQVLENRHIRAFSVENLKRIFTTRGSGSTASSYYPVRTLTFAADHQLWGLKAGGFKLTNGLIHLANVLLVFWLVLRLFRHPTSTNGSRRGWDICVATFTAGVFAIHPVVVEPVAWVAGREELLMALGTLGCIHFHLSGRRQSEEGGKTSAVVAYHACAALCCAVACMSNAVAAVIPAMIVAWDLVTQVRPRLRKIVYGTSALWVIGVATIVIKKLNPDRGPVPGPETLSAERLAVVLKAYWLNLKTLIWPTHLAIDYPGPRIQNSVDGEVLLGGIVLGVTCLILWKLRHRKLFVLGLLWFGIALGPASQIMPHHIFRADRFLYLPLVGLAVTVAMVLRPLSGLLKGRVTPVVIAALGLLGLLAVLSAGQVRTWRSSASMWENCLRVDPNNALAHSGIADVLAAAGQFDEAIKHYRTAVLIDPDNSDTLRNFAVLLATCHRKELRNYGMAMRLAERACELTNHSDPASVVTVAEIHAQAGRSEMAVAATEEAIALAEDAGDEELAGELRSQLKLYQNRGPIEGVRQ